METTNWYYTRLYYLITSLLKLGEQVENQTWEFLLEFDCVSTAARKSSKLWYWSSWFNIRFPVWESLVLCNLLIDLVWAEVLTI